MDAQESGVRFIDLDAEFSRPELSGTAIDAAIRTSAKFDPAFPGWFLYRRVIAGCGLFDRVLEAWAIGMARQLARAKKRNGRDYIRSDARSKPGWIAQAGRDALDFGIYGRYPEAAEKRSERFGVAEETYLAVRDPCARCMWVGIETYRSMLHAEYWDVRSDEYRGR